jgi:drug/metabolite transporter (DMT)-like permease
VNWRCRVATVTRVKRIPIPVLFCGVAFCWGMNSVAMRYAGRFGPPLSIAAARSAVGATMLLILARRSGARWPNGRQEFAGVAAIGIFMTGISTACLFLAAKQIPAGLVSIFSNTMPLFTALLAVLVLKDKVTPLVVGGLLIGMCGTVIVGWRSLHGDISAIGILYGLGGGFFTAIGSVLYKRFPLEALDKRMLVGCQLAVSAAVISILAVPDDRSRFDFAPMFWLTFAYLSLIGLALSFVMYSSLLSRASVMVSGSAAYLATVCAVLLGWMLLDERLSWLVLIGGAVTIGGVSLVQVAQYGTASRARAVVRSEAAATSELDGGSEPAPA